MLLRDVTERRQLEEQLRQAQKMEAVGKLAGGVAHDFNNLLTAIIGFASLASDELPAGGPVHRSLAQIRQSAEQAASLTRQLLAFGRRQILLPEVLDLGDVVENVLPMLRRLIGEDITVTTDLGPDVPAIRADRTQVQQVLLNLVVNARDAMPRGGALAIRTSQTTVEAQNSAARTSSRDATSSSKSPTPGRAWTPQPPTASSSRSSRPRRSARAPAWACPRCTGSPSRAAVTCRCESTPGRGATFRVLLPAAPDARTRPCAEPEPAPSPVRRERHVCCWWKTTRPSATSSARCCAHRAGSS